MTALACLYSVPHGLTLLCVVIDTEGTGHYVGCVLSIDNFDASDQEFTWPRGG